MVADLLDLHQIRQAIGLILDAEIPDIPPVRDARTEPRPIYSEMYTDETAAWVASADAVLLGVTGYRYPGGPAPFPIVRLGHGV